MLYIAAHTIDRMEIMNLVLGRRNDSNNSYGGSNYNEYNYTKNNTQEVKNKDGTYG